LEFNEEATSCYTLDLIKEKHPFTVVSTPTNDSHCQFLQELETVVDITNHQSMFSGEEEEEEKPEDMEKRIDIQNLRY
jgi:hypothetical protein